LLFAGVACRTEEADVVSTTPDGNADAMPEDGDPAHGAPVELIDYPFEGKIAIVTVEYSRMDDVYFSAQYLVEKLGSDKILHRALFYDSSAEGADMTGTLLEIAEDPEVKALVINSAINGTNAAVDALLELRDDIFIVLCDPAEFRVDLVSRAHLYLDINAALRGETIIATAKSLGAEVFAHYSFPRHLAIPMIAERRELMIAACEREGIVFIDLEVPDPSDPRPHWYPQFYEDVPRLIAEHGKNIAFFATNCASQAPIQRMVIQEGAIFPEPCCPSPYHAFPVVFEVTDRIFDGSAMGVDAYGNQHDYGRMRPVGNVIKEIRERAAARGATGRLATWPVSSQMMYTYAGVVYAIKWINGEGPREKGVIDYAALEEICEAYIYENTGERLGVELNPLSISGRAYQNYVLILQDSLVW